MATKKSIDPESTVPDETTPTTEGTGEAVQITENHSWYRRLNEDWLATGLGLLLVLLIVIHLIHSIP